MLVIRLARTGKKKQAYFRIVVAEKQRAVGAKFIEILGNYNPHLKQLVINQEKLAEYLKNGAQPSNTLAKVLKKEGIKMPKWVSIVERNRPTKKVEEEKPEPKKAEEAPADEAADAPVAEEKAPEVAEEAPIAEVTEEAATTEEEKKPETEEVKTEEGK